MSVRGETDGRFQCFTDQQVADTVNSFGIEWLPDGTFPGTKKPQKYRCVCGNVFTCSLYTLKQRKHKRCKDCSKELCKQDHLEKHGCEYPQQRPEVKAQREATCMEKFGSISALGSPEVQAKGRETCKKKYGEDHNMKVPEIVKKATTNRLAANEKKYGDKNPMNIPEVAEARLAKAKATLNERYHVDHIMKVPKIAKQAQASREKTFKDKYNVKNPMEVPEFVKKQSDAMKATFIAKYGVDAPMKVPEIVEKSMANAYDRYPYTLPSGKVIEIQGYENMALDDLFAAGYTEKDVAAGLDYKRIPIIDYQQDDDTWHKYYPDIYIKSENKIVEVKSEFYYKNAKAINLAKYAATIAAGYAMEFWVYDKHGNRMDETAM